MIYLDNNSTTKPDSNMIEALSIELENSYGNPSSLHKAGNDARDSIEYARSQIAQLLNVKPKTLIFTSGGTEANNLALGSNSQKTNYVLCSVVEHDSAFGFGNQHIGIDRNGILDLDMLEKSIAHFQDKNRPGSELIVSIMMVNNDTGVLLDPNKEIAKLKAKYAFTYHVDAVQAFGKLDFRIPEEIDLLTISAHKAHGLKGCGVLYVKDYNRTIPRLFLHGGAHEFGVRPGTENFAGIFSLGYMAEKINKNAFYKTRISNIEKNRNLLEKELQGLGSANGCKSIRVGNTSNIYFEDIKDNYLFLELLSKNGLYASVGSACSSGLLIQSKTISAMFGKDSDVAKGSVRFSLSVNTTEQEIYKSVEIIKESIEEYRRI